MGEDRVMLGSDYPYPLGEERIGELIRKSRFSDVVKRKMLASNAGEFFGLNARFREKADSGARDAAVAVGCPFGSTANGDNVAAQHLSGDLLSYESYLRISDLLKLQNQLSS